MTVRKEFNRARFGQLNIEAKAIWNGPDNIIAPSIDADSFYGWSVLRLYTRPRAANQYESRIVYANTVDKSQKFAILRAVQWDGKNTNIIIRVKPEQFEFKLPARFVQIPISYLERWLEEFAGQTVRFINNKDKDDYESQILGLRVELDYIDNIIETAWQHSNDIELDLSKKWLKVWDEMGQALITSPVVKDFDEDFRFVTPEVQYDFEKYGPNYFANNKYRSSNT